MEGTAAAEAPLLTLGRWANPPAWLNDFVRGTAALAVIGGCAGAAVGLEDLWNKPNPLPVEGDLTAVVVVIVWFPFAGAPPLACPGCGSLEAPGRGRNEPRFPGPVAALLAVLSITNYWSNVDVLSTTRGRIIGSGQQRGIKVVPI